MRRLKRVLTRVLEKDDKWIQKAIKHPGALTKKFPNMAKDGFTNKELDTIISKGGKDAKRAQLAKTLKGFKK